MKITMEWAWTALAHHLPSDPAVWDPSGVAAAVARHQNDLVLVPEQPAPDTAWRAAAFLHTLAVCPALESPMNEFYAAAAPPPAPAGGGGRGGRPPPRRGRRGESRANRGR
ncbi:hypothetical protein ACFXPD_06715, partial [Streptomyces goshikiensis]